MLRTIIISSDYQAHFSAVYDFATSLISLNNHLGPWSVFSAVSVLTIQLSMNSLNIYYQFYVIPRFSSKGKSSTSPQPKRQRGMYAHTKTNSCWELPFCTSINLIVDNILKYVSVENQIAPYVSNYILKSFNMFYIWIKNCLLLLY